MFVWICCIPLDNWVDHLLGFGHITSLCATKTNEIMSSNVGYDGTKQTDITSKWIHLYRSYGIFVKSSALNIGIFGFEWMIVRLPLASFNMTDENGANFVRWYTQWSSRMPRSRQSSIKNENARDSDNVPINSQSQSNCRKTVQIFDALPPRCHRPFNDLRKKEISGLETPG